VGEEGGMILPDLAREIAWWQARMRPSDERFGNGIADWTITAEYVDRLSVPEHGAVWGLTCSPSSLPEIRSLTPEDISAKRAHIMVRTPVNTRDLTELAETLPHELVHVLDAPMQAPVSAEENAAHSLAPLLAELRKNDPARATLLARAIANPPMARAYREKEGDVPEPENKEPKDDKAPAQEGGDKKPPMQEGAISLDGEAAAEIVAAGDANAALEFIKKLLGAAAGALIGGGAAEPAQAPEMGMKPEDQAYARAMAGERKEMLAGLVEANPHLDEKQKAAVIGCDTVARARVFIAAIPRVTEARMGLGGHPATAAGGGKYAPRNGFKPSGNKASMARLRVVAEDDDIITAPGCRVHTAEEIAETGKLMTMSIWDALPAINKAIGAQKGAAQ
jgi:hypothetical protein